VIYGVQALQVILAAIARSDGSRAGVSAAVLSGTGVTIPAAVAILGNDVKIDPATGDVNIVKVTFLRMRNHRESYLTNLAIS
jgi:branched-chain amino acid transport system substrate-binding protein